MYNRGKLLIIRQNRVNPVREFCFRILYPFSFSSVDLVILSKQIDLTIQTLLYWFFSYSILLSSVVGLQLYYELMCIGKDIHIYIYVYLHTVVLDDVKAFQRLVLVFFFFFD